jgi:peptide/nickel transport system ATP-binding protein
MTKAQARERTAEMLRLVDIAPDRMRNYPHQFSGGMRQRIVIAICMALDPQLVVMDEPTTALDVVVQREILQRINELRKQFGFSVLFITHDLGLMVQFCDRIGIMLQGKLVEQNSAEAIYKVPQHEYTRKLWASFPSLHGGVLL